LGLKENKLLNTYGMVFILGWSREWYLGRMDSIFGFSGLRGSKWIYHMIILDKRSAGYEFVFKFILKV
jgi:hypothetical protein